MPFFNVDVFDTSSEGLPETGIATKFVDQIYVFQVCPAMRWARVHPKRLRL